LAKCIICGRAIDPPNFICDRCSGRNKGNEYIKVGPGTLEKIRELVIYKKGEGVVKAFVGSVKKPRVPRAVTEGLVVQMDTSLTVYVLVTNERVLMIEKSGLVRSNLDLFQAFDLEDIQGMSIKRGFVDESFIFNFQSRGGLGEVLLSDLRDLDKDTLEPKGFANLEELRRWMNQRIQEKIKLVEERARSEKVQVLLDFNLLKSQMERGGIVLQALKCPNCGAKVDLPEYGHAVKCGHCGSSIVAQDIFDRLKSLIGQA